MEQKCLKCLTPLQDKTQSFYGLHKSCFKAWFCLENSLSRFKDLAPQSTSSSSSGSIYKKNTDLIVSSFFHGAYKKYSSTLEGATYLIKMKEDKALELPDVEYLCNQIAKELKIPVAEFFIINWPVEKEKKERVFVTKIFTKKLEVVHLYRNLKSGQEHNCEQIIDVLRKKSNPQDVQTFVFTVLFDSLIGNHDRHGRNLAFIRGSGGQHKLAPIYDNVSSLALEKKMLGADFSIEGCILTSHTKQPTTKDYVKEFNRLGFSQQVNSFFKSIKIEKIEALIGKSFCSADMKKALNSYFSKQYKEFKNAL